MATLNVVGMDDVAKIMQKADLFDEETQTDLLLAGTRHLRETIVSEISRARYNLKFVSPKLTKQTKAQKDKNGNYYMTVSVSGKNQRGEKNAVVAFVLNYGRSEKYGKIEGSYYWTIAVSRAEKTVVPIYEEIIKKKMQERGVG